MRILNPNKTEIKLLVVIIDDRDMSYILKNVSLYSLPFVWDLTDKALHEPQPDTELPDIELPYDDDF